MTIDQQLVTTPECIEEDWITWREEEGWITDDQHAANAWWDSQSDEIPTCDDIPF